MERDPLLDPSSTLLFSELRFLCFFIVVFGVHWALRKSALRKLWLLVASYAFYAGWDWRFLGLILLSTVVDFITGYAIGKADPETQVGRRKAWMAVSLIVNLGLLGFFKYFNFFVDSATSFSAWLGLALPLEALQIVLPVGISFYTFQTLSYTIDIYRGQLRAVKSPLDFALFVAFFPQLVAGPIVRARDFLPQLRRPQLFSRINFKAALLLFLFGFIKKTCVADNFGLLSDAVFANSAAYGPASHWLALSFYYIQIYCDFSGYSDMAIATAALLGYQLVLNFDFPYVARSLAGFWRRWHISMTGWFRDYIFIPLGGSRSSRARTCLNLIIVFSICGLWHGASWNFVLFGLYHGLFLAAEFLLDQGDETRRTHFGIVATTWIVAMSMVLFRTSDVAAAAEFTRGLYGFTAGGALESLDPRWWLVIVGWGAIHAVMARGYVQRTLEGLSGPAFAIVFGLILSLALPWAAAVYQPFIYFQF